MGPAHAVQALDLEKNKQVVKTLDLVSQMNMAIKWLNITWTAWC